MPAKKQMSKAQPAPLNFDLVWAALDDVVDALERGVYLRGDKESTDLGQSWAKAGYLPGLYVALREVERVNEPQEIASEPEPAAEDDGD